MTIGQALAVIGFVILLPPRWLSGAVLLGPRRRAVRGRSTRGAGCSCGHSSSASRRPRPGPRTWSSFVVWWAGTRIILGRGLAGRPLKIRSVDPYRSTAPALNPGCPSARLASRRACSGAWIPAVRCRRRLRRWASSLPRHPPEDARRYDQTGRLVGSGRGVWSGHGTPSGQLSANYWRPRSSRPMVIVRPASRRLGMSPLPNACRETVETASSLWAANTSSTASRRPSVSVKAARPRRRSGRSIVTTVPMPPGQHGGQTKEQPARHGQWNHA